MKKLFIGGIILFSCLSAIHGQTFRSTSPTLSANATQICFDGTSYPLLKIVSGSGTSSYVGSVINDPTDPIATKGIYFKASNATGFSLASSNTSVVTTSNISMTFVSGDTCVLKIKPTGVGYATITVQATNGSNTSATYTINVAASAASAYGANTIFPTIIADASAVAAIDSDYMFIADDETNVIRMFNRKMSGQSLYTLDITSGGGGASGEEFDLEAATVSSSAYNSGRRIYWMGSLGNSKKGASKPYRDRVIATDMSGSGVSTTLTVKSYSANMRSALISWGDANSWGFTASAYAASSGGMIPKRIDGFNIEGLSVTHAGETAYVGFRAPCVPIKGTTPSSSNRKYALLAPITNFETMMNVSGKSSITPTIGEPVLFDFAGLGIRDLVRVGNNKYILIAGLYQGGGTPAVYLWDGVVPSNSGTNPITTATSSLLKLPLDLTDLVQPSADGGVEGHPEAILAEQVDSTLYIHLICDNGTVVYYNDAQAAKDLSVSQPQYSKFRMDSYKYSLPTIATNAALTKVSSVSWTVVNDKLEITGLSKGTTISVFNPKGQSIATRTADNNTSITLPTKGVFIVNLSGNEGSRSFKVLNK